MSRSDPWSTSRRDVDEPGTLTALATAILGLLGLTLWRRRPALAPHP